MRNRPQKSSRTPRRKTELFTLWLPPEQKRRLERLAETTGVDQSKLARRALLLLFEAFNRGQLELGFPETVRLESSPVANTIDRQVSGEAKHSQNG